MNAIASWLSDAMIQRLGWTLGARVDHPGSRINRICSLP